jgi:hypothetical protein
MKINPLNEREIILEATIFKKEKGKNEKIRGHGENSHFARQTTPIHILYAYMRGDRILESWYYLTSSDRIFMCFMVNCVDADNACDWGLSMHVNVLQPNHHFAGSSGLYILFLQIASPYILAFNQPSHSSPLSIHIQISHIDC